MDYVYMNQMMVSMHFLLSLVMFKLVGDELEVWSNELNYGSWIQACLFHLLQFWYGLGIWGPKWSFISDCGDLEWFQVRIMWKKEEKAKTVRA